MLRKPEFSPFLKPLVIFALFFISLPAHAQKPGNPPTPRPSPTMGTNQQRGVEVSGMVFDAQSNTNVDGVRVELHAFAGGAVATAFTSGNGNFQFYNINPGSYTIVAEVSGYQPSQQRVDIQGNMSGVTIEIRPIPSVSGVSIGKATISKRELSIPHNAHDAMQKGLTLLNGKSDYQGSVKQFQRAVQEYPDYYEAYTEMGVAYIRLGDAANAEAPLRKAVELSEQHYGEALYWLALLLSNNEKFAEAEPLARKAVELDANSWQANSELARALDGLGRASEAETSALEAIKLRPDNANLHLLLANIHGELGNEPALLEDLNTYLKLAPKGQFADQARKQRDEVQQDLQNAHASPTATPSGRNP
jgi:Tfp pilus assembly protein PilF